MEPGHEEWSGAERIRADRIREVMGTRPHGDARAFGAAGLLKIALLYATRWLRRGQVAIPVRNGGALYIDRRTAESDWQTLREMLLRRKNFYATEYDGAVVVDIGGHKGYFGAYVLLGGAACVYSYEPAAENYAPLERAASSFRRAGRSWTTRHAAVGARAGTARLWISAESWSHSLSTSLPITGPARMISSETVDMVSIESVLRQAAESAGGRRLVVKIDAEGAECDICTGSDSRLWQGVDELFVETHTFADCGPEDIVAALRPAGLVGREWQGSVLRLQRLDRP